MKYAGLLVIWLLCSLSANAQKGIEDGSRFGHGEDSVRCIQHIALYKTYLQKNDFAQAYSPWKSVFTEAPWASPNIYTDGTQILRALIADSDNETKEEDYLTELMNIHDQHIQYLDSLNTLTHTPVTPGFVLGMKIHDYVMFSGTDINIDKAYRKEQEAIGMEKEKSTYYMLEDLMDLSLQKLKTNAGHIEQFIQDYLKASRYIRFRLENTINDPQKQHLWSITKDYIDTRFIESRCVTCEDLQKLYAPKIEQHRTDLAYINLVLSTLRQLKCTGEEVYLTASEAAYTLTPTARLAAECGRLCYQRGKIEESITYFDEAAMLAPNPADKAEYCYRAARVLFQDKQWKRAKQYALKSISLDKDEGKPYILIAQMYASNPNWCKEATLNQCTYFAVIDKLQKAQSVDTSTADEATQLINTYQKHIPTEKALAGLGLKKGNAVILGGWINETIILR